VGTLGKEDDRARIRHGPIIAAATIDRCPIRIPLSTDSRGIPSPS
jgi:hypothetical protein